MKYLVHIIKIDGDEERMNSPKCKKLSNTIGIILKKYKNNVHKIYLHNKITSWGPVYSVLIKNTIYYLCLAKSPKENLYCLYRDLQEHEITNRKGETYKTFKLFTTHEKNIRFI